MRKIVECVPNFSEGKRKIVIDKIEEGGRKGRGGRVLDVEWNASHNRSLMTIVGGPEAVFEATWKAIKKATDLIDMRQHRGEHPRIGAVDVVPFVPVSGVSIC